MESNFFKQVVALNVTGDLNMTIKQSTNNQLVVSLFLNNPECTDKAAKLIPPLIFRGSAENLDNEFFQSIAAPLKTTSELFVNMANFDIQLGEAQKQSAMEKTKAAKIESEKTDRQKKYDTAMKKADELDKEGKPRDAWMKVPSVEEFPEYQEAIRKRRTELSDQFAPDLFNVKEVNGQ